MKRKTFTTVSGYLRSMADDLSAAQSRARQQGREPISAADGRRRILNTVFEQLGIGLIADDEPPADGVRRLQQTAQNERQTKALAECLKWITKPILSVGSARVVGERVEDGKRVTTYLFHGFARDDTSKKYAVILDSTGGAHDVRNRAHAIVGSEICLHSSENIENVSDDAKGVLLTQEELWARVPALVPKQRNRA